MRSGIGLLNFGDMAQPSCSHHPGVVVAIQNGRSVWALGCDAENRAWLPGIPAGSSTFIWFYMILYVVYMRKPMFLAIRRTFPVALYGLHVKTHSCIPGSWGPPRSMPSIRSLGRALENGSGFQPRLEIVTYRWMATRNPARKPVEVGSLSHHLQGFLMGFIHFKGW